MPSEIIKQSRINVESLKGLGKFVGSPTNPNNDGLSDQVKKRVKEILELRANKKEASNVTDLYKTAEEDKIPLKVIKKMPYKTLMRMINKAKKYLKTDETMVKIFKEYDVDINEIDLIPTYFKDLEVSAKCDHGIIYLNYSLLCDGDFFRDYSYLIHEYSHWLQQTTGSKATKSSDDGDYLHNEFEQEGFSNQVEYIANQFGDGEAEKYVDDLLEHHEVDDKKEKKELKEVFLSKV